MKAWSISIGQNVIVCLCNRHLADQRPGEDQIFINFTGFSKTYSVDAFSGAGLTFFSKNLNSSFNPVLLLDLLPMDYTKDQDKQT